MSIVVPDKIKQMGVDKNFKIVDAEDVELKNNEYSDVQSFVDGFKKYLTSVVNFKNDENGKPIYGDEGQFAISNADGTISFTSTTSATDPDLIASDGTKFKFGTDGTSFGYILTSSEGKETFYPFKSGGDGEDSYKPTITAEYKMVPDIYSEVMCPVIDDLIILSESYTNKTYDFSGEDIVCKEITDSAIIGTYDNKISDFWTGSLICAITGESFIFGSYEDKTDDEIEE